MSKKLKALCLLVFTVALMALPAAGPGRRREPGKARADLFKLSLIVGGGHHHPGRHRRRLLPVQGHQRGVRGDLPEPGRRARHPRPAHLRASSSSRPWSSTPCSSPSSS